MVQSIPRFFILRLYKLPAVHTTLRLNSGPPISAKSALVVQAVECTALVIGLATALAVSRDGSIQLIPLMVNAFLTIAITVACAGRASRAEYH
jgi:hypothetical protein